MNSSYTKYGGSNSKSYKKKNNKVYRECNICGKELEATTDNFSPQTISNKNWVGLRPDCKSCRNAKARRNN